MNIVQKYGFFPYFTLSALFFACSTTDSHDPLLEEAYTHHQAAMVVHDSVLAKLDLLKQQIGETDVNDSISNSYLRSFESIEGDFTAWDESLVSVPGYEEEHDHDHDHDHDHEHHHHSETDLSDMSPEMILELQQELEKEIERIQVRADSLLSAIK